MPIKSNSRLWCGPTCLQNFAPTTRTYIRYKISRLWCAPISTKTFSCLQCEPLYVAYFSAYIALLYIQNLFALAACVYIRYKIRVRIYVQNVLAPVARTCMHCKILLLHCAVSSKKFTPAPALAAVCVTKCSPAARSYIKNNSRQWRTHRLFKILRLQRTPSYDTKFCA